MPDANSTTRDRLMEAARELFASVGYHATTTPMLARRAGVAEGTIYRHFPGKQALLNAAYREVQHWGRATIADHDAEAGQTADRLAELGRHWLEVAEQDPARMLMLLNWQATDQLDEASRAAARELSDALERILARGKQQGQVRAGAVELWATVWLHLVGLAVTRVATREWPPRHPHALALLDAAWEAIAWRPIVPVAPGRDSLSPRIS